MDYILLGILMLKRMTVYEMRVVIRKNFKSMCSDSIGSVKAALAKLEAKGMVSYVDVTESNVNKRIYSITDAGRKQLMGWLRTPADMTKSRNVELGKLLFMGLIPAAEQQRLVTEMIATLQSELEALEAIKHRVGESDEKEQAIRMMTADPEYLAGIQAATSLTGAAENAEAINRFEMLTLQYGIDETKFKMEWFRSVRDDLEKSTQKGEAR